VWGWRSWWNERFWQGETEVLGENLPRRYFAHHKSHLLLSLCSLLQEILSVLSLQCLHQSLPGDGSQQCPLLPCSRSYGLVTVPQLTHWNTERKKKKVEAGSSMRHYIVGGGGGARNYNTCLEVSQAVPTCPSDMGNVYNNFFSMTL
jgi:hypothetical protein